MEFLPLLPLVTFFVTFFSSILSGVAHGGGGFIVGPYWLLAGLTPAQGASTGAFMSAGISIGSIAAFRNTDHLPTNKRVQIVLYTSAAIAAVVGAIVLPHVDTQSYKLALAIITIIAVPMLFIDKSKIHKLKKYQEPALWFLAALMIPGAIIGSSAFSVIFTLTLITFFGMSLFQVTALRRMMGLFEAVILFTLLTTMGHFVWEHAVMGIIGSVSGSYIGTKYAIKKGEKFAKYAISASAITGASLLLFK